MALKRFVVAEELASILPNMLVVVVLAKGINNESSNGGVQRCYEVKKKLNSPKINLEV